ncbi:MAG TPA: methionine--tRNA ligase [Thermoanaerobaculia bacterium]|nr:methionine--tRNA ligase [Thermoanaerobaculia bacterium]
MRARYRRVQSAPRSAFAANRSEITRMKKPFYISTAIHYANDLPHIGHIYENVVADVIARHRRRMGDEVFFLTGTDEHGQKIERSAEKAGVTPIELADRVVEYHHQLWKTLGISHDDFIRTTEDRHKVGVHEIVARIRANNPDDIYIGEHTGWYCQSEEAFFPESQVAGGKCENGHPVEQTSERNYFFRLSKYAEPLLAHYKLHPEFIQPATRMNEVRSFVESGLRDLSISRTAVTWGIPFPGDPAHIVYVWLDALTNYISALGFGSEDQTRFERFWPASIHLIGKDIVRFHAVYWPAFLISAGLPLPERILGHGWWLRDNVKMSKSVGNVVRPDEIIETFGADAFRFFLLREMVFGQDSNYSDEAFLNHFNSDLANDLGNTLSRAIKMTDSYFDGKTPPIRCMVNDLRDACERFVPDYLREMEQFAFQRALDAVWKLLDEINTYIVTREPWRRFKQSGASDALARILWDILEALRIVWVMMAPFMPQSSAEALRRLGATQSIDSSAFRWGLLPTRAAVIATDPIFPRIDIAAYLHSDSTRQGAALNEEKKDDAPSPATAGPALETTQAITPDANRIKIDQFFEIDLRVAEVLAAKKVEKSKKLLELRLSLGDSERTVVAGIASKYQPEELIGRKVVIVANLQPAKLMGIESNGMVLAASIDGEPSLLAVDQSVPAGTKVK